MARSLDRLLTYAKGRTLDGFQLAALKAELDPGATRDQLFGELSLALERSAARIRTFSVAALEELRTVGGLLVHVADHTERHVVQAITTAKILLAHRA